MPQKGKQEELKMTGKILNLRQQIMPRNDSEYMMLNKNIKNKCKQAKDERLNEK